jgi:hypothetical protein
LVLFYVSDPALHDEVAEVLVRKILRGVPSYPIRYNRAVVVKAVQIVFYGPSLRAVVDIHDGNDVIRVDARGAAGLYDVENDVESSLAIGEKRVLAQDEPSKFPWPILIRISGLSLSLYLSL